MIIPLCLALVRSHLELCPLSDKMSSGVSSDINSSVIVQKRKLQSNSYTYYLAQHHEVLFFVWKMYLYFIKGLISASLCLIRFLAEDMRWFFGVDKQCDSLKTVTLIWSLMKFSEIMKRKESEGVFFCFGLLQEEELHGLNQSTNRIMLLTILEWKWT